MNDDTIADLKQFITVTLSQQLSEFKNEFGAEIRTEITAAEQRLEQKIGQKIDDLSVFVGEALETTNNVTGTQLKNHETRITKLEQSRA